MSPERCIYLDHAATSWPKAPGVAVAVAAALGAQLGNPGRAGHRASREAADHIEACRDALARLLGERDTSRVVLAPSCTQALSAALFGVIARERHAGRKPHVATTASEHNAVLRPLFHAADTGDAELAIVPCDSAGRLDPQEIAQHVQPETALVALAHASNVTGIVHDVRAISDAVRARAPEALIVVDAAQTIGMLPVHPAEMGADLVAIGGHKGLLGPPGTGALWVGPRATGRVVPLVHGGTGDSRARAVPDELPRGMESGTANAPACAGLLAALPEVIRGLDEQRLAHELALADRLARAIDALDGIEVVSARDGRRVPVVACRCEAMPGGEYAAALDASFAIACRSGLHCCPLLNDAIGCPDGTLRFSIGWSTTEAEIDAAIAAMRALTA